MSGERSAPEVRLQKFLASHGVASRRAAETMIREGRVRVDGQLVLTLGTKIDPGTQKVTVDGKPVGTDTELATIVLYKPTEVVCSMKDPQGRATVAEIVGDEPYRLLPIGRLDYHSEGVLLMTNDGELMHRLLHPKYKAPKVYRVKAAGRLSDRSLERLRKGIQLEEGKTQPASIERIESGPKHEWLEFVLLEGKNRQIRRMLEAVGHRTLRVVRVAFAGVEAGRLRPGQFAYLDRASLGALYAGVELEAPVPCARRDSLGSKALGRAQRRKGPVPSSNSPRRRSKTKKEGARPRRSKGLSR